MILKNTTLPATWAGALGLPLPQAVEQARAYILGAIAAGAEVHTGQGHGPLNHGYAPVAQHVLAR